MPVRTPSLEQILRMADQQGLHLSVEEAAEFRGIMAGTLEAYRILDELPEPKLPVVVARTPGWRPSAAENLHNGWYWRTEIATGGPGPLHGKRVAVKDDICVAGVPMMNGSALLEGYVPDVDATVVTRILQAGGTIAGKAACENLCFSGASHTCVTGPIRNPHKPTHSAGGSSGGSAALVARAQSRWRSAATREVPSARRRAGVASMD